MSEQLTPDGQQFRIPENLMPEDYGALVMGKYGQTAERPVGMPKAKGIEQEADTNGTASLTESDARDLDKSDDKTESAETSASKNKKSGRYAPSPQMPTADDAELSIDTAIPTADSPATRKGYRRAARPQTTMPYDPMLTPPQTSEAEQSESKGGASRFEPDTDNESESIPDATSDMDTSEVAFDEAAAAAFAEGGEAGYLKYMAEKKNQGKELVLRPKADVVPTSNGVNDSRKEGELDRRKQELDVSDRNQAEKLYREALSVEGLHNLAFALEDYVQKAARRERSILGSDKEVEAARMHYEELRSVAKLASAAAMSKAGMSRDMLLSVSMMDDETESRIIAQRIADVRIQLATPEGRFAERKTQFYDWWVRLGGGEKLFSKHRFFGSAIKGAVFLPVGAAAGVTAGLALAPVMSIVAGGLLGGAASAAVGVGLFRSVARGFAMGRVDRNANDRHVARPQAEARLLNQQKRNDATYGEGRIPDRITDGYAEATAKEVKRNRRRLGAAAVVGAVSGAAAAYATELITNGFSSGGAENALGPKVPHAHPDTTTPPAGTHLEAQGKGFNVEAGSGEIREIQEYAATRGHQLTGEQATRLYEKIHDQFGRKIVDLDGTSHDTYFYKGDVRLSRPGSAHWFPGVEQAILDQLKDMDDAA